MLVKDDGPAFGSAPKNKPEGAKWADPLEVRSTCSPIALTAQGYLEPGFEKIFVVPATGGSPRQLTFGPIMTADP